MGAFNQLLLYKQIEIPLSREYLENNLSGEPGHGFTIVEVNDHQYKCLSNFSLGTAVAIGGLYKPEGIKMYMQFEPLASSQTTVTLRTKIRFESIIVALMMVIFILVAVISPPSGFNNYYLFLFPLLPVWFWFVYRVQEYLLMGRIEKYLNELVANKTAS